MTWIAVDGVVWDTMPGMLKIDGLSFLDWKPITLEVAPGEVVGIAGASGSGKSLLLRAVADLDLHLGSVALDGIDCGSIPAPQWRRKVAMLPAESRWWFTTVGEHFLDREAGLVGELGFGADVFDWEISRLSVGERQRLALARLLDRDPEFLLLDEPTANLDADTTRRVEAVILATGLPALWVSHD
ncbi:MAG: ABC transporter ATP-binding protein, partial [Verrucomicrobiales bacterium]